MLKLSSRKVRFGLVLILSAFASPAFGMAFGMGGRPSVPEIDPLTASSGIALLVGGAMLLRDRYFQK